MGTPVTYQQLAQVVREEFAACEAWYLDKWNRQREGIGQLPLTRDAMWDAVASISYQCLGGDVVPLSESAQVSALTFAMLHDLAFLGFVPNLPFSLGAYLPDAEAAARSAVAAFTATQQPRLVDGGVVH